MPILIGRVNELVYILNNADFSGNGGGGNSSHANTANLALFANSALFSNYASFANSSLFANLATWATTAVFANTANVANSAGYATIAGFANTANVANTAGYATIAGVAEAANTANLALFANSSLFANDAQYLNGHPQTYYTNATNLTTGTVPTARLGSGTANSTTYLAGDQTYKEVTAVTNNANTTTNGLMSFVAQTFAGVKTFNDLLTGNTANVNTLALGGIAVEAGTAGKVNGSFYIVQKDDGNTGPTITIDWSLGNERVVTMNADTTITFTGGKAGGHYVLVLQQDSTGEHQPTFSANVVWNNDIVPNFVTTGNTKGLLAFYYDGTEFIGAGSSGTAGFRATASVYQLSDEAAIGDIERVIEYGAESWDIGGFWDVTDPSLLIIPTGLGGIYSVVASVSWAPGTLGVLYNRIYVNGSLAAEDSSSGHNTSTPFGSPIISTVYLNLAAGDEVEMRVYYLANPGYGNTQIKGGVERTFLQIAKVA